MKTGHFFALLNFALLIMTPSSAADTIFAAETGKDYVAQISTSFNRLAGFSAPLYALRRPPGHHREAVGGLGKDHDPSEGISAIAPPVKQVHPCLVGDRTPASQ
jgi:hypothetical protein